MYRNNIPQLADNPGCDPPSRVLSIRQPWAWLIIHAGKDIENRNWSTKFRGRIWAHAGKGMTRDEYFDADYFVRRSFGGKITLPPYEDLLRGGIIGSVDIVDCVSKSDSPWFFGKFGFVLSDPQTFPFYECKGQLGFFSVVM